MFTASRPLASAATRVRAVRSKHTIIKSGSSESEVIALAVIPVGPFSENAVTTQTPVANCPIALLNRLISASSAMRVGIQPAFGFRFAYYPRP
jgi:hypothetical protein